MNYPKWWNETLTVFNKYLDEDRIARYTRKVVSNAYFSNTSAVVSQRGNEKTPDGFTVRIRKDSDYVTPMEWNELLENKYTLRPGDIIIKGIIEDEIQEEVIGKSANDLLAKYGSMGFIIKGVKENLKVELPHYWVSGE